MKNVKGNTAIKSEEFENSENVKFTVIKNDVSEIEITETETTTTTELVKPIQDEKKVISIQEIKERANQLVLLSNAHSDLMDKRKEFEDFKLVHDFKKPEIRLTDVSGEVVKTFNQNVVEKFYIILFEEYNAQIEKLENELNKLIA